MATWLQTTGTRTFAYCDFEDFLKQRPEGAHLVVQCDAECEGVNVMPALHIESGLYFWMRTGGKSCYALVRHGDSLDTLDGSDPDYSQAIGWQACQDAYLNEANERQKQSSLFDTFLSFL